MQRQTRTPPSLINTPDASRKRPRDDNVHVEKAAEEQTQSNELTRQLEQRQRFHKRTAKKVIKLKAELAQKEIVIESLSRERDDAIVTAGAATQSMTSMIYDQQAVRALLNNSASTFKMQVTCVVCLESQVDAWVYASTKCDHLICVSCFEGLDVACLCVHTNTTQYALTNERPLRLHQHSGVSCPLCRQDGGYKIPPPTVDLILTHSREDAKVPYECSECKASFQTNREAVEHHFNTCTLSFKCPNSRDDGACCSVILKASRANREEVYYKHVTEECQFVCCNGCYYVSSWVNVQRCLQMHAAFDAWMSHYDRLQSNVASLPHLSPIGSTMPHTFALTRQVIVALLSQFGRSQPYQEEEEAPIQVQQQMLDLTSTVNQVGGTQHDQEPDVAIQVQHQALDQDMDEQ